MKNHASILLIELIGKDKFLLTFNGIINDTIKN